MQLFILDKDPVRAAGMLCDAHLRKMCLENCQILSGVTLNHGLPLQYGMPKVCNIHHPVIRALDTPFKINWAVNHNFALQQEYFRRFGKRHAYAELPEKYHQMLFSPGEYTADWSFARCFNGIPIDDPDIIEAFREYYRCKKSLLRRWHYTNAPEPAWLTAEKSHRC